jgi:DNA polymerase-3 subunit gamma/tau
VAQEQQHQALYRRYRPQTPGEVIGQDHVVRALTGAIRENRLHHAFLFCGPRGTGKTSTARILAKMVNCEQGPTAEPCGSCRQCLAIKEGVHLDVIEIDAASHGGVEDARELREKAPTAPVQGREKVYIIDEAQRLSREAFDALLKVFEEPPPGVRFVLATTEPHKMPATIVGRCQRFDFRRLSLEQLTDHLQKVAAGEGVALDSGAAHTMARQAEGSARDALSLLDQASVLGGQEIDDDVVRALLGAPHAEIQSRLADAIALADGRAVFELVHQLVLEGQDLRNVTAETLAHFRDLLLVKTAPGQQDLVDVAPDAYEQLRVQAERFTAGELSRILALLLAAQADMRWTTSPRLTLELALIRATMPDSDGSPEALVSRLERLERLAGISPAAADRGRGAGSEEVRSGGVRSEEAPSQAEPSAESVAGEAEPSPPEGTAAPSKQMPVPHAADASSVDVALLRRSWPSLVEHLGEIRQPILRALLESATVASFDGTTLELAFPPDKKFGVTKVQDRQDELTQALSDLFGIRPQIVCVVRESKTSGETAEVELVEEEEVPDDEEALRRVQEILGAQPEARAE